MRETGAKKRGEPAIEPSEDEESASLSIWLRPAAAPRRGVPLTRARLIKEAVALLDSEGLAGLTMRRLAERLDTGSTTLYRHIQNKADVFDLALDTVFGEIPLPPKPGKNWKNDIRFVMTGWRAAMLRHPWSTALPGRPLLGPHILQRMEFLQATLVRAGFGRDQLSTVTWFLANYVLGTVTAQVNWHMPHEQREVAQGFIDEQRDIYPTLSSKGYMLYEDRDASFNDALNYLLDGLDARRKG